MAAKTRRRRPATKKSPAANRNGATAAPPKPVIVDDSTLRYQIKGQTTVIELNPLKVKLISQPIVMKHKLEETADGGVIGTWPFAEELAAMLEVPATVAMQAWIDACEWWAEHQKKTS